MNIKDKPFEIFEILFIAAVFLILIFLQLTIDEFDVLIFDKNPTHSTHSAAISGSNAPPAVQNTTRIHITHVEKYSPEKE